jgi:hypothetical protein
VKDGRKRAIEQALEELMPALGDARRAVPLNDQNLRSLHEQNDFAGMVRSIRNDFKLPLRIRLGIANDDEQGPKAPAWIYLPNSMPRYGSEEFKQLRLTMFMRRTFLKRAPYEAVVMAIAHELSHIVTASIGHRMWRYEEATDLTAMILGFRLYYLAAVEYVVRPITVREKVVRFLEKSGLVTYSDSDYRHRINLGYLSKEEVAYAAKLIEQASRT